jgi:hypothetical protein
MSRNITVRAYDTFAKIAPLWPHLTGLDDAPFLSAAWLGALEETGCVDERRGWIPHHLAFFEDDELLGAAPAYLKLHSEGEFVFDYAWANAARRFGVAYYPKLLVASPFTPANGPRVLVAQGKDRGLAYAAFAATVGAVVEQAELSSAHVLFLPEEEAAALADLGMLRRAGLQFHWHNRGYGSFEDFLRDLPSKRRTQLRRERKALADQGVVLETLSGHALTPDVVDAAYGFYLSTVDKFLWGRRYLTRAFFESVASTMRGAVEIVVARDASRRPIAGAFNLRGQRTLFGRYWGAGVEVPFLHFNVCYYHSIERCIAGGLVRFEPGAGGEHKAARGFRPTLTHSVHYVRSARFARALQDFCDRERELLESDVNGLGPRRP